MDNSNPIFVDFFGIYGKFNGTPWINCRQKWNVQGFPENSRPGNLLQFAIEHDHRNSGFSQLEHGGSFHSYVAVYLYQRVSSSLLDFENWVYSLVDPKKFPFCNGRSVGRSRSLSLSLFLPPPLSLSLSRLFHFWEFYLNITCDFLRWLFDGLLMFTPKKGVSSCLQRNFLTPVVWLNLGWIAQQIMPSPEDVFSHQSATNWFPADFVGIWLISSWYLRLGTSNSAYYLLIVVDSTPTFFLVPKVVLSAIRYMLKTSVLVKCPQFCSASNDVAWNNSCQLRCASQLVSSHEYVNVLGVNIPICKWWNDLRRFFRDVLKR